MTYPKFAETFPTDISWVGDLPKNWKLVRLGFLFDLQKRPPQSGQGVVTAFRDGQVTLRSKRRVDGYTEADKEIGYQTVLPGDLVIHAMDAFAGAIGVSDSEGKCSPVCSVCKPREGVDSRFYGYAMRHIALSGFITSLAKGIRERSTDFRWADARLLPVPVPPNAAQIVTFIRRETAKIDRLIAKQKRLIELLQEKRQAVISRAVTKGLDPNVKMKDSGVEWLGEVPEHWVIRKIKSIARFKTGSTPSTAIEEFYSDSGFPWYRPEDIVEGEIEISASKFLSESGERQVAISEKGSTVVCCIGTIGKCALSAEKFSSNQQITAVKSQLNDEYFFFLIASARKELENLSTGNVVKILNSERFGNLFVAYPKDVTEQKNISSYCQAVFDQTKLLQKKAVASIELLQEHRQALISAAVTGKIDVRGLVSDEEVAALDAGPEDIPELEVVDASYITEEEQG